MPRWLAGLQGPWLGRRPLVCKQVVEMVTGYLEDFLSPGDRERFEEHLAGCPHCAEYLAQMRETIRLAGQITPGDFSAEMRDAFTDLYRRWRSADEDH
jgi:anti-sigma factor RsiW